jgi:Fe2+ transport system protein FeoA
MLPSDDDLKTLAVDWALRNKDIAKIYGVNSSGVCRKLNELGVHRGRMNYKIPDDGRLKEMLSDETKTRAQLATELGVVSHSVWKHSSKLGISRKQLVNRLPDDDALIRLYRDDKTSINKIVAQFGVNPGRLKRRLLAIGLLKDAEGSESHHYPKLADAEHHRSDGSATPYHILVAEKMLGRTLKRGELVHHIDLIPENNSPGNLYICESRAEHSFLHSSLGRIAAQLYHEGVVGFKDGKYYVRTGRLRRNFAKKTPKMNVLERWYSPTELRQHLSEMESRIEEVN